MPLATSSRAGASGPVPQRPAGKRRWVLVGALLVALLLLGVYNEVVIGILTTVWQRGLGTVGLARAAGSVQQGIDASVTKRMLPAVATYAALYLSLCLLLLHQLLTPAQWRLTWRLYAAALIIYAGIVVLGKLAGNAQWAYQLSRDLLDFVVSPLPVAGLYVLFRAGFGPVTGREPTG